MDKQREAEKIQKQKVTMDAERGKPTFERGKIIGCRGEVSQERPLVLGLVAFEDCQHAGANTRKQKDHLLAEGRGGSWTQRMKAGGPLYRGIREQQE